MQNLQIELLQLLQQDCRLPLEKLAVMLGQTPEAVGAMIDDMLGAALGSRMTLKHGAGLVRGMMLAVLALLLAKMLVDMVG